jgi:hypothetical protein
MVQLRVENIMKHNTDKNGAIQYTSSLCIPEIATQSEPPHHRPFFFSFVNLDT